MGMLKFPAGIVEEIHKILANFWWGNKENARKLHWKNWRSLCKPKWCGGLGFRDMGVFNEALLAKQVWRLLHRKDSLCAKVMKAKYYPNSSIMEARLGYCPSYLWKSLWAQRV